MTGHAKQSRSFTGREMDCFVASLLAMTPSGFRNGSAISRRDAPEPLRIVRPKNRGRGECRVPAAPAASCALVVWHTSIHHESTGTPGIPARNGFNGFLRALPGARIPFATVVSGYGLSKPGRADLTSADLTPATGARTTRLRRPRMRRSSACRRSLTGFCARPAITSHAQRCRVHRIPPRVRDDRDTPLMGVRRRRI
jgi:hypothetical protein